MLEVGDTIKEWSHRGFNRHYVILEADGLLDSICTLEPNRYTRTKTLLIEKVYPETFKEGYWAAGTIKEKKRDREIERERIR